MTSFRKNLTFILLVLFLTASLCQAGSIDVLFSGNKEEISATREGSIEYISFSELADILGGTLDWKIVGHQITYDNGNNRFDFTVGSPFVMLNDTVFNLTHPTKLVKGQLFVPAASFIPLLDQVSFRKIIYSESGRSIRIESEYFNVTDMAVSLKANGLLIEIFTTTAMNYDIFVTEGNWVNVSIRDAVINGPRILSRKDSRVMYRLKTHQARGVGQISFRLKRSAENLTHKVVSDPPRIQISIADAGFNMDSTDTTPSIGPDDKIDVIVVDAGHGGADYGAIGSGGTREKDVALSIAKELAKLIRKEKRFKIVMTRDRDKTVSLQERADIANRASADLFISIHANSSLKKNVRGWNVFFLAPAKNDSARAVAQFENSAFLREQRKEEDRSESMDLFLDNPVLGILNEMLMTEFQAESHDFAMMLDREIRRKINIPARGVDQAGFFVLNKVFTPSVLIECGFISNKHEEKLLKGRRFQKGIAGAIYKAIKRFKLKYESK